MTIPPHAGLTDVGRRRDHNEDAILLAPPLFAVADGVGGAAKGEVASNLALDSLAQAAPRIADAQSGDAAKLEMERAMLLSNAAVHTAQSDQADLAGMGTVLTAAFLRPGGEVVLGHAGDSRAYAVAHDGAVRQLTQDHSLVGELVRAGQITAQEASVHPQRNVITRALGPEADIAVDTQLAHFAPGEWLLLCSDGLTGHVPDWEIGQTLLGADTPDIAVRQLVDMANERGGTDNISVIVVRPLDPTAVEAAPARDVEMSGELTMVPLEETPPRAEDAPATPPPVAAPVRRPRARYLRTVLIVLFLTLVAFTAGAVAWRQSYFLTERSDGTAGIDQGFPVLDLHREYKSSDVQVDDLEPSDRERYITSETLRDREDAEQIFDRLPELAGHCDAELNIENRGEGEPALEDAAC